MAENLQNEGTKALNQREHNTDASAKRVVVRVFDPASGTWSNLAGQGLVSVAYDYISYTATSGTVDTYVYKSGGSGGITVATVTVTYTDISHETLVSVART